MATVSPSVVQLGSIPASSGVSQGRSCSGHGREHDDGIVAHWGHGFKRHVAPTQDSPLVELLHEDGADQPGDGSLVRKDANDFSPALDFPVETLDGVGAMQLGAMLLGKGHVGQHVGLGIIHQSRQFRELWAHLVGHGAPLLAGGLGRVLGKGGADEGRDHPPATFAGVRQGIAHEVDATALPTGAQQLGDRRLDPFMRVRDHQLHPAQAPARQLAQEGGPEGFGLRGADVHAQHSRRPSLLTPTAIITATETIRPFCRTFT